MDKEQISELILTGLQQVNFADRYYDFCRNYIDVDIRCELSKREINQYILESYPEFKRDRGLFCFSENTHYGKVGLHISFLYNELVELIFALEIGDLNLDNQVTVLAREVAQIEQPGFINDPPYPKIPFVNKQDLKTIVDFSIVLFEEYKKIVNKATS